MMTLSQVSPEMRPGNGVVLGRKGGTTCVSHGAVSVAGRRREMEDRVSVELGFAGGEETSSYDFYGVFDGHGGDAVAERCRERMGDIAREEMEDTWKKGIGGEEWWEGVMERSFERMDGEVGGGGGEEGVKQMTVGSTAVVAVVGMEVVVVANCGDSRAVLYRNGVVLGLSVDHKPDRPDELARIEAAGGRVIYWNGHRILGVLSTSRSIGDHYLKPYVTPKPEVTVHRRTEHDEFLILATDGLWDVISSELACQVARRCLSGRIPRKIRDSRVRPRLGRKRAADAAGLLVELALSRGSKDNISVVVVELKRCTRFTCL